MECSNGLQYQILVATIEPRARYIMTAFLEGRQYEVGEAMIGPDSDVAVTETSLLKIVEEKLRLLSVPENKISEAVIMIQQAPVIF